MRSIIDKRLKKLEEIANRKKITIPNIVFVGALDGETDIEAIKSISESDGQEADSFAVIRKDSSEDFTYTIYDNQLQLLSEGDTNDGDELSRTELQIFRGACERTLSLRKLP